MPVEKINDKRYREITSYKCDYCNSDYSNQRELQEHMKLEHKTSG
jgi:transposase-like protein